MLERLSGLPVYRKSISPGERTMWSPRNCEDATNGKSLRIEPPPRHVHYNPEFVCVSSEAVLPGPSSEPSFPVTGRFSPLSYILRRPAVSGRQFAKMKSKYRLDRNDRSASGSRFSPQRKARLAVHDGHRPATSTARAGSASTFRRPRQVPQAEPGVQIDEGRARSLPASRSRSDSRQRPVRRWLSSLADHIV